MSTRLYAFVLLIGVLSASALSSPLKSWFTQGIEYYEAKQYDSALVMWQKVIDAGVINSDVYYNMANAWYRQQNNGKALLYYYRAQQLSPSDEDIEKNIAFVKEQITDKFPQQPPSFVKKTLWHIHTVFSYATQVWVSFFLLVALAIMGSALLFIKSHLRIVLGYLSILTAVVLCINLVSVGFKYHQRNSSAQGVILSSVTEARNGPEGQTVLFSIHQGTRVHIIQQNQSWSRVRLENGISGWVKNESFEKI